MDKIHTFEEDNTISFSNRQAVMQFVAEYFAFLYKQDCEFWKATAMDDRKEMEEWDEKIKTVAPKLEKKIRQILGTKRYYFSRNLKITGNSPLLKQAFKEAKISLKPQDVVPVNLKYEIKGLVFERHPI